MINRIIVYKQVSILSIILFFVIWSFSFGVQFFPLFSAHAAAITWDGGGIDADWCTDENWSNDVEPTASDDVIIDAVVDVVTAGCVAEGHDLTFNSLTIGGTNSVTLTVTANMVNGGDMVISNGTVIQNNNTTQYISSLTIEPTGTLTHTAGDGDTQNYRVDFSLMNVTVQNGGTIDVVGKGYPGYSGVGAENIVSGRGPGGGTVDPLMTHEAGGGAHAGQGGDPALMVYAGTASGGDGYGSIVGPTTWGSAGGSATDAAGGFGGGVVKLHITRSGTVTIDGTLVAGGTTGGKNSVGGAEVGGGGAGGSIWIEFDDGGTFAGSGTLSVAGGNAQTSSVANIASGGGGGGHIAVTGYTTYSHIGSVIYTGGVDENVYGQDGGGGTLYIQESGTNGDVFFGNSTYEDNSTYIVENISIDNINFSGGSNVVIDTNSTITLAASTIGPLQGISSHDAVVDINGSFIVPTTFTIPDNIYIRTSVGSSRNGFRHVTGNYFGTLTISDGGTLELENVSTSSAWVLTSLVVNGTLTAATNTTEIVHTIHISADTITVGSSGSITADNKGYIGGSATGNETGSGPGGGTVLNYSGAGGSYGGNGGNAQNGGVGGTAYGSTTTPHYDAGSGGGGGSSIGTGGNGGGIISLSASETITHNGTITANGQNGSSGFDGNSGGGAGGGIYIETPQLSGSVSAVIRANGGSAIDVGGSGGGGRIFINTVDTVDSLFAGTVSVSRGSMSGTFFSFQLGSDGSYESNQYATVSNISFVTSTDGSGDVLLNFVLDDSNDDTVRVKIEYESGSCSHSSYDSISLGDTVSATYGSGDILIDNDDVDGYIMSNITTASGANTVTTTWQSMTDSLVWESFFGSHFDGTFCIFVTPNDGKIDGTMVSSTLVIDNVTPTAPGNLTVAGTTDSSITLNVGSASTDTNFSSYKIYYHVGTAVVTSTDSVWTSAQNANLAYSNYGGASSITITGLTKDEIYSFNIFAYDSFGNSASASQVSASIAAVGGGTVIVAPAPPPPPVVSPDEVPVVCEPDDVSCQEVIVDNPSGLILINNGDKYTNSRDIIISFDANFVQEYALSWTSQFLNVSYAPIVPNLVYTLPLGDGEKKLFARFRKTDMGTIFTYDAYDTIFLDTVSPEKPVFLRMEQLPGSMTYDVQKKMYYIDNPSAISFRPKIVIQTEKGAYPMVYAEYVTEDAVHVASTIIPFEVLQVGDSAGIAIVAPVEQLSASIIKIVMQSRDLSGNISLDTRIIVDARTTTDQCIALGTCIPVDECSGTCEDIQIEKPLVEVIEEEPNTVPVIIPVIGSEATPTGNKPVTPPIDPVQEGIGGNVGIPVTTTEFVYTTTTSETYEQDTLLSSTTIPYTVTSSSITTKLVDTVDRALVQTIDTVSRVGVTITKTAISIAQNDTVEEVTQKAVVPTATTAAVINAAASAQIPRALGYLRYIFAQPVLLIRRRKQKKWGVVYNAFTKQPVDLAMVRLIDAQTGHVLRTQATDRQGRFFLMADKGRYTLSVQKTGYSGLSEYLDGKDEDSTYIHIYHGDIFEVEKESEEINYNIALDPQELEKTTAHILRDNTKRVAQRGFAIVGIVVSTVSFVITPTVFVGAMIVVHGVLYTTFHKWAHALPKESVGKICDAQTHLPLSHVVVRIFDATYNKLIATTVSDRRGRYALLVGPSTYYATYDKKQYKQEKTGTINLTSTKTNGMGGIIAQDMFLEKIVSS